MIRAPRRALLLSIGICLVPGWCAAMPRANKEIEALAPPKHFTAQRISSPIKIDGHLDEAAWAKAAPIPLPVETRPGENIAAPVTTECFILYDQNNLYIGFRAHDPDPSKIRARLADRDTAYSDDFVGVVLDTFDDQRRAFEFFVNPFGVQMDLFNDDVGHSEDDTWDAIWESAGRITPDGYEAEMKIPFSSLRFPDTQSAQTWGIDVIRFYPRQHRYRIASQPLRRNIDCYLCQLSKLDGIEGVRPARDLELDPTVTATRSDAWPDFPMGQRQSADTQSEVGLTASWGMTPNLILNGAINPDFSQVEADALQLDVNNQFALFYPERRPFFLEGADFFATPLQAVFTRNVADPSWGLKLSGKEGDNALGVFLAQDDVTPIIFPGSQRSRSTALDMQTTDAVMRYRRDVGKNSTLGVLLTSRSGDAYVNRVGGIDGLLRFSDQDSVEFQLVGSHTEYPHEIAAEFDQPVDGFDDHALHLFYSHQARSWVWEARYQDIGRNFRADLGFIPQVDRRYAKGLIQHNWWGDESNWWNELRFGVDSSKTDDQTGELLERLDEAWFILDGPRQSFFFTQVANRTRSFNGVEFDEQLIEWDVEAQVTGRIFAYLSGNAGDDIDFSQTRAGRQVTLQPGVRWDFGRHLRTTVDYTRQQFDVDEGRLFTAALTDLRLVWQFNLRTFVRAIFQYTQVDRAASLYTDPVEPHLERLFTQLLFSYKINPRTVLFIGYSDTNVGLQSVDRTQVNRTYFTKIGYAWSL